MYSCHLSFVVPAISTPNISHNTFSNVLYASSISAVRLVGVVVVLTSGVVSSSMAEPRIEMPSVSSSGANELVSFARGGTGLACAVEGRIVPSTADRGLEASAGASDVDFLLEFNGVSSLHIALVAATIVGLVRYRIGYVFFVFHGTLMYL